MKAIKDIGLINLKTGEIIENVTLFVYGKPKDKGFTKVFHVFAREILEDKELPSGAYKVLLYIIGHKLRPNSLEFHMTSNEVCEALDISDRTYKRWVAALIKRGYIKRLARNVYKIRPYSIVVGTMAEIEDF